MALEDSDGIQPDQDDIYWMRRALAQAGQGGEAGEVPVGAVLVSARGELLAEGHNRPISSHDPTAHAEIRVLREAAGAIRNYRLVDTTLYVTLEPCAMCVGALVHARIGRLVYAAREPKTGAIESAGQLLEHMRFNHRLTVEGGLLKEEASRMLSEFFARRRAEKKSARETTHRGKS
jgi:tRNA(adenine34) deaminase